MARAFLPFFFFFEKAAEARRRKWQQVAAAPYTQIEVEIVFNAPLSGMSLLLLLFGTNKLSTLPYGKKRLVASRIKMSCCCCDFSSQMK